VNYSVIIPTYNRAHCVGEAIESALAQTLPPHEVIVVDDGSTDETARVLEGFSGRIRVIRQANAGVSAARNAGIDASECEWAAFLDSDDDWVAAKMASQSQLIDRYPEAVLACSNGYVEGDDGKLSDFFVSREAEYGMRPPVYVQRPLLFVLQAWFLTPGVVARVKPMKECRFDASLTMYEDLKMWACLAIRGPMVVLDEPSFVVRSRGASNSLTANARAREYESLLGLAGIYEFLLSQPLLDPTESNDVSRRLGGLLSRLAGKRMSERKLAESMSLARRSLAAEPTPRSVARVLFSLLRCAR
jgi:glycosyltransferase involved in cell wall biosynthesis